MSAETRESSTRRRWGVRLLGPYAAVRGNRNLALLFGGQVISGLGDWLYVATISVLAYSLTGSAMTAAALSAVRLLPYAIFLPLSGVLADRLDRRMLMITADLGRALCMLGLLEVGSRSTIWIAFPLVFAATSFGSLFRPALGATLPAVAGTGERLTAANALISQVDAVSLVLGPALAGILLLCGAPRLAFAFNAVSYAVSAATLASLRLPPRSRVLQTAGSTWFEEASAGIRFLFGADADDLAAITVSTAAMCAFLGAGWTLFVALATQTWQFGSQGTGYLLASFGLGGLIGGFCVEWLTQRVQPARAYVQALLVGGAAIVLLGIAPGGILPFALLAAFGGTDVLNQVLGSSILQRRTPEAMLGRVFGAFEAVAVSATVFGALVAGPLLTILGPRGATLSLALAAVVALGVTLAPKRGIVPKPARY